MTSLARDLRSTFRWRSDRTDDTAAADLTGWWRDPAVLAGVGPALAELFATERPTVVLGTESSGMLLGPLTATALGVGFVPVRKDPTPAADSEQILRRTAPPDYRDRHVVYGFPRRLVSAGDRALLVDDWIETGATAVTVRMLVEDGGARWLGVATVVDALGNSGLRRGLTLRALLHVRDLGAAR